MAACQSPLSVRSHKSTARLPARRVHRLQNNSPHLNQTHGRSSPSGLTLFPRIHQNKQKEERTFALNSNQLSPSSPTFLVSSTNPTSSRTAIYFRAMSSFSVPQASQRAHAHTLSLSSTTNTPHPRPPPSTLQTTLPNGRASSATMPACPQNPSAVTSCVTT